MANSPPLKSQRPIQSFTDLETWREGHKLVLMIYKATESFPDTERFGLTSQLRRAAVSITSNIAEGFRRRSTKEKRQFYTTSLASLTEVQNQLLISKDVNYMQSSLFQTIAQQSVRVGKLTNGLIRTAHEVSK